MATASTPPMICVTDTTTKHQSSPNQKFGCKGHAGAVATGCGGGAGVIPSGGPGGKPAGGGWTESSGGRGASRFDIATPSRRLLVRGCFSGRLRLIVGRH